MCIFSLKAWYMISKIKILGQILALWDGHFNHFQGKKYPVSGVFESCFGVVQESLKHHFRPSKVHFCVFSAQKVVYYLQNLNFKSSFDTLRGSFDHFQSKKNPFSVLSESCVGVVQNSFRHCFYLNMITFARIFSFNVLYMTSKVKILL